MFDVIIIGGGFYGCMISLFFSNRKKRVLLIEKEERLLKKASYNNQARVHNGYHYPRSFITALRSHINFSKFLSDFPETIDDNYTMIYAIARNNSKTTASQFKKFCQLMKIPVKIPPTKIKDLFDSRLIENAFIVEEGVFSARKLRVHLEKKIIRQGVKILYGEEVIKVSKNDKNRISVFLKSGKVLNSDTIINCTYSQINTLLVNSRIPTLSLKHEMTEMPLIKMPEPLNKLGVTIMDGPFFSIMPFPDKALHTLHHVRYTPQYSWIENNNNNQLSKKSDFLYMIKDVVRYIPSLKNVDSKGSIYETKTTLIQSESNDSRPILYKKDYGITGFDVVLGGKIDNIYDILTQLEYSYDSNGR